ncbi:MAG: ABC-F family ATP-binding cassette domain-containing protein [bacterium]
MIFLKDVAKQFGNKVLFKNVDLQVGFNDRIGLIGQNGSGKTTIFSLILGEQAPDAGHIERNKNMIIGCLKQEVMENFTMPLLEEVANSSPHISRIKERIAFLQEEIAHEKDREKNQDYLEKLGQFQHQFESYGGYDLEHQAKRILFGLGFKEADLNRRVEEFSGGWRMRVSLAKLLLQEPDLLLLDEPTNHLDLESVIWLEEFLKGYRGGVIVISHDRIFLNNIVTCIEEIDQKTLNHYPGNYDSYITQKKARQEILEASYKNQQKKIEATKRFIERFRYKATKARQVQSRIKSLEKMNHIELEEKTRQFSVTLPPAPRSGKVVLDIKNVRKQYGEKVVYNGLNLTVGRGDRIALIGPNGAGKSTLLKIMAGVLPVEGGSVIVGHNVSRAYFAQHQLEILTPQKTVIEEIDPYIGSDTSISARTYLGGFLFSGDEVFKKIEVLSGGEKNRLVLAKMLLSRPNLLLLDEPTNHLDIPSRDCLQEALKHYTGAMCMISHDRVFVNQLANKVIKIEEGHVDIFHGNYDDFLRQIKNAPLPQPESNEKELKKERKSKDREQKRREAERRNERYRRLNPLREESERVQRELSEVLKRIEHLNTLFTDPTYYQGPEFGEKLREYKELEARNQELTNRWTELEERIEAIENEFSDNCE